MTKQEFFKELNQLLEDISSEEKEEAIRFYENYFDDAGKDNEEEILKELISPQKVAGSIKQSINLNERDQVEQGYFTEKGYEDDYSSIRRQELAVPESKTDDLQSMDNYTGNKVENLISSKNNSSSGNMGGNSDNYQNTSNNNYYDRNSNIPHQKPNMVLLIILGIILFPIGLPIVITILAFMFSIAVTVLSIWVAFVITTVAMLGSAVLVLGISVFQLFTIPALGFLLAGVGLIIFGVGILFLLATIWMTGTMLPFVFKSFVNLIKLPFRNRRVLA